MAKKPLLTKARQQWANSRGGAAFRGKPLNYNASIQVKYVKAITSLVAQMTAQTNREIKRLYESDAHAAHFGQDASIASQARIVTNGLTARFESLFAARAQAIAEEMANKSDAYSKTALYASLKDVSGGLSLKTDVSNAALNNIKKAVVAENVSLIKSIPQKYLSKVTQTVLRSITNGNGLQELIPKLEEYEGQTHRSAKNMALDQTRKAYNAINKERAKAVGIKKFEWIHSGGGQKSRELHIELNGQVFSFDDPPIIDEKTGERGMPGQAINCKCTFCIVVEYDTGSETSEGNDAA